jgi:hypothetical protein
MTKQQLAESLQTALRMFNDTSQPMLHAERIARAFGYLEQAVREYVADKSEEERKNLKRYRTNY